jgi:hypothetical protein
LAIINNVIGNGLMKAPKGAGNGQKVAKMAKNTIISKKGQIFSKMVKKGKVPIIFIIYWLLSIM